MTGIISDKTRLLKATRQQRPVVLRPVSIATELHFCTEVIVMLAVAFGLNACASTPTPTDQSYIEPTVNKDEARKLANDTATFLIAPLPPAHTTLVLDPREVHVPDAMTAALVPALRARGYGVRVLTSGGDGADREAVSLHYIVSPLDGGILLRLQYSGTQASWHYPRTSDGQLMPGMPLYFGTKHDEQRSDDNTPGKKMGASSE